MKKTLTPNTSIVWLLSLARDPDAVVPEGIPEELADAQGKYGLYVLLIPEHGVAITCQRSTWDPVILGQGIEIPSNEAAHFIVSQCLNSFMEAGPSNPVNAVQLSGDPLCWGSTEVIDSVEVNTFPEAISERLVSLVKELIDTSKAEGVEPTRLG